MTSRRTYKIGKKQQQFGSSPVWNWLNQSCTFVKVKRPLIEFGKGVRYHEPKLIGWGTSQPRKSEKEFSDSRWWISYSNPVWTVKKKNSLMKVIRVDEHNPYNQLLCFQKTEQSHSGESMGWWGPPAGSENRPWLFINYESHSPLRKKGQRHQPLEQLLLTKEQREIEGKKRAASRCHKFKTAWQKTANNGWRISGGGLLSSLGKLRICKSFHSLNLPFQT